MPACMIGYLIPRNSVSLVLSVLTRSPFSCDYDALRLCQLLSQNAGGNIAILY